MQPAVPDEQRIIVLPEGERSRHYLFSVTAIRGRNRNLSGIVLLLRDVTRLREVEQLKSEFVMAASHALRTPLLFDHVQTVFKSQLDIKEVVLISELTGDPPKVRADANKITWVLTNLVSNALRYVRKDGRIQLMAHRMGPHVHLSVRDDGPGIPLAYQLKIFQKFVQIKGQEAGGTGLGLAICKEIVRAHGGAIWVESSAGRGSTFTLPVAE